MNHYRKKESEGIWDKGNDGHRQQGWRKNREWVAEIKRERRRQEREGEGRKVKKTMEKELRNDRSKEIK